MGCELLNGIVGVCDYSASGVERLWLANKSEISGITYNSSGVTTGITFTTTGGTFYEIVPALDSCTFQDDLQVNGARRNFLQTVNFGVGSLSSAVLSTLETMGLSNMIAIVKTAEGDYRGLGFKGAGLRTTVMTETSGTQAGNDGALAVTIAGNAKGKAPYVSATLMGTLNLV
jgi:hypothetical protein